MPVSYISHIDYTLAPEGLEVNSLLGNSMVLSSAVTAGATSLPIEQVSGGSGSTVDLNFMDRISIYDGLNTEVVLVSAATQFPTSSIPIMAPIGATYTGCQFNHVQYTPCSSPGSQGDLGGEILKASAWLENITKQSLWSTTQTVTLRIPTQRASFDNQNILTFRVPQYPITAINSLSLGTTQSNFVSYDPTQCFIDANELVTVPVLQGTGSGSSTWPLLPCQMSRQSNMYLQVGYSAGYTLATMPADIKDATVLLVNDLLSRRDNPSGVDSLKEGQGMIVATLRGDTSGESLHVKRAKNILANYVLRMF